MNFLSDIPYARKAYIILPVELENVIDIIFKAQEDQSKKKQKCKEDEEIQRLKKQLDKYSKTFGPLYEAG